MKRLLFLCTGNYYRSRFAEEYFNHHVRDTLDWCADSAGLQRDFNGNGNVGPMAHNTLAKLQSLNIQPRGHTRFPKHVQADDFSAYDRVVAVSKAEHEPMLQALWPESVWKDVVFFDVEDLHIEGPETALPRLITHLDDLLAHLA